MSTTDRSKLLEMGALHQLVRELCTSFSMLSFSEKIIFCPKKAKLLKFIVDEGLVERGWVDRHVHFQLLELGEATFEEHKCTGQGIDNCLHSHRALGYALLNGRVSADRIKFDHGETADDYTKFAEGLVASVVDQLLDYKDPATVARELVRY